MTLFLKMLEWQIAGRTRPNWLIDALRNRLANKMLTGRLAVLVYIETINRFYYF